MTSRRHFLHALAAAAASSALPRVLRAGPTLGTPIDTAPRAGDPMLRELATRALDAATSAGASYADVRFTVTRRLHFDDVLQLSDTELVATGVRALVNGEWGFVASPEWTPETMARLGRAASAQAKANAWPGAAPVELGERPPAAVGTWVAPVKRDPFQVSPGEIVDFFRSVHEYVMSFPTAFPSMHVNFQRQERTFASTEGAFCTQTLYHSLGGESRFRGGDSRFYVLVPGTVGQAVPFFAPALTGYEVFEDEKLLELIPELYERACATRLAKPVSRSRYDVVFDGHAMAALASHSLGRALEIDRALGLEANAGGTSYLTPANDLGKPVGSPLLQVNANRSRPGGAATVKWDDDGVAPEEFSLVKDGVVVDYATSREHAGALAQWYQRAGRPLRSHGCAGSETAMGVPLIQTPNLQMLPGAKDLSMMDLIAGVTDGVAVFGLARDPSMDHQQLTGQAIAALAYRIRKGKLAEPVRNVAILFRSPELWKNLVAVGGARTVVMHGFTATKGQPGQATVHSVEAPAAVIRNLAVVDIEAAYEIGL